MPTLCICSAVHVFVVARPAVVNARPSILFGRVKNPEFAPVRPLDREPFANLTAISAIGRISVLIHREIDKNSTVCSQVQKRITVAHFAAMYDGLAVKIDRHAQFLRSRRPGRGA